jgi:hypothetical protein
MEQNQKQLWRDVIDIKRRVLESIGPELSAEFRGSQVYQAYTALCAEAQLAYTDGLLTPGVVDLLEEYADRVIAFYARHRVPA